MYAWTPDPVRFIPQVVVEYRAHGAGQMSRKIELLVPDMIRIFDDHAARSTRVQDSRWMRAARSGLYRRIGSSFYVVRDFPRARHWLWRGNLRGARVHPGVGTTISL